MIYDTKLIRAAREFAYERHYGQMRKYTGLAYHHHLENVAGMVMALGHAFSIPIVGVSIEQTIAAAYLHDTLEDTDTDVKELEYGFGKIVANIVVELTDYYTPEMFPNENRAWRKEVEAQRLGKISPAAKLIKWCDLIDNTRSIVEHDPKFAIVYLREKARVLEEMGLGK